jgi:DNA polymerase III alpha subunit (gram-positive type)
MSQGFAQLWPAFMVQIRRADILCGQNLQFDMRMIAQEHHRCGLETYVYAQTLDTMVLDWALNPGKESYKLECVAARWDVPILGKHRAADDAGLCARILVAMMDQLPDDKAEMIARFNRWEQEYRAWREKRQLEREASRSS